MRPSAKLFRCFGVNNFLEIVHGLLSTTRPTSIARMRGIKTGNWDPSDEGWLVGKKILSPELPDEALSAEEPDKLRDAMQAERAGEQMAMDAQRTWTEAQRATQLVRKDRGFGASFSNSGKGNSSGGKGSGCFLCGGHYARDCPDRRHPSKGEGKHAFMLADPYNEHFFTGKSGKKGKGWKGRSKSAAWAEHDLFWISRGKGKSDHRPTVNAYVQDMYGINGLEMHPLELSSVSRSLFSFGRGSLHCRAADHLPSWDGQARSWRRYYKEVAWCAQSTPAHKRRYLAAKLFGALQGS